jgi:hypothetical protein
VAFSGRGGCPPPRHREWRERPRARGESERRSLRHPQPQLHESCRRGLGCSQSERLQPGRSGFGHPSAERGEPEQPGCNGASRQANEGRSAGATLARQSAVPASAGGGNAGCNEGEARGGSAPTARDDGRAQGLRHHGERVPGLLSLAPFY